MTVENINIDVKTNAENSARQFHSLSASLNGVQNAVRKIISTGIGGWFSKISKNIKSATGALSQFASSLKRIAFYRILRTIIKEISQAFQEGLKNAYAFSAGINGSLATAMDSLATKSLTMKNQLGAAFGALLEAITPILLKIIELVTRAAAALTMLFSLLGGGGTYLAAKDTANAWDKASGAAKEYKKTLLGFDEINRLNDETGGGGGGGLDANNMFDVKNIPQELLNIYDTVKNLIDHGNWASLGSYLAAKINGAIKSIDLWGLGETLGQKLNNLLTAAFTFLRDLDVRGISANFFAALSHMINQIDFTNVGGILARLRTMWWDLLLGALEGIDWKGLGKAASDLIKGYLGTLVDWFNAVDWKKVGKDFEKAFLGFLKGVDWKGLTQTASDLLKSMMDSASTFIAEIDWYAIGDGIYNFLKETLDGIDFAGIASSFFTLLGNALAAAVKLVASFISDVVDDIAGYFSKFIEDENNDGMFSGGEIIKGVFKGIVEALKNVCQWIFDNIVKPFIDAFESAFGISSPAKEMEGPGEYVGQGILEGILKPFKDIYSWVKTNITDPLVSAFQSALGIFGGSSSVFSGIGSAIADGLLNGLQNAWTGVSTWLTNAANGISNLVNSARGAGTTINDNGFSHSGGNLNSGGGGLLGIRLRASGGWPDEGEVFISNERGPELVGTIGGNTAVATNDDIVAAVSAGVYDAVSSAMGGNERPVQVRVFLDSREIRTGQNRLVRAMGV